MSTKYLLNFVDSRPRQAPQLKALVAEARESGVRDEKASFHEFVETLDRITQELRSDPNAVAFLSRVKKTEAPDYYDIIKKPMDLGTVLKKVKQGTYKTKAQFKEDLDLIWSNCFQYNSYSDHPLRASASALRTKSKQLLEFVTDPSVAKLAHTTGRSASHPSAARPLAGIAAAEAKWATRRGVDASASLAGADAVAGRAKGRVNGVAFADEEGEGEEVSEDAGAEAGEGMPFEDRPALSRTAEGMATFVETREAWEGGAVAGPSIPRGLVNGDARGKSTGAASSHRSRSRSRPRAATVDTTMDGLEVMEEDPLLSEWTGFLQPAMFASGVPELPLRDRSDEVSEVGTPSTPAGGPINGIAKRGGKEGKKGKGKADGKEKETPQKKTTLAEEMRSNIATLRRIGKVHGKIAAATATPRIGMDPDPIEDHKSDDEESDEDDREPPDLAPMSVLPDVLRGDPGVIAGRQAMQHVMSMILAHAGFNSVQSTALHSLTEIGTHYLLNLGRTLRFYTDRYSAKAPAESQSSTSPSRQRPRSHSGSEARDDTSPSSRPRKGKAMSASDMLMQTLRQNGVPSLGTLQGHIYDDVERHGARLKEVERKLLNGFKDIVENGVPGRPVWGDDNLFAKDGEAMVTGDFANELGEDFWGMRDLGLDSELGMGTMRIPSRLFYGRPKEVNGTDEADSTVPTKEPRFVPPPAFVPLTAPAIEGQIGLLQPFFRARQEHPDFRLLEDPEIPKGKAPKLLRPKVPPSGKIPIKRKQADGGAGGTAMSKSGSDEGPTPGKKRKKAD